MSDAALAGKKVLIVEDDALLFSLLSDKLKQLRDKGVEVFPTVNGEEALTKCRQTAPDLVLLDLMLPGMSGFEFLAKLRAEAALEKTPVLILSNLSADTDREKAKALGVIGYLVKADLSLTEISTIVEDLLEGKGLHVPTSEAPEVKSTSKGYVVYL